ncbi:MAG: FAD-dependent oxidoreductase, partial [Calditrichaeota bacterium]|nr:FAD-dependent oxidoreductase [Calditrichota bacterium]
MKHVLIIGNGISGITAARHIRKGNADIRITVISGETDHFFSRTALMYIYMGHMKFEHTKPYEDHFWQKNRIELLNKWVDRVDTDSKRLHFSDGTDLQYDQLILATGSKPNKFGWPGQDLKGVQGLYSYQDLLELEKNTHPPFTPVAKQRVKRAVLVGGGL